MRIKRWIVARVAAARFLGVCVAVLLGALVGTFGSALPSATLAFAEPTTKATADQLFVEGRALLEKGEYKKACEKFKGSYDLDPAGGALLNLAACYERDGRTASAYRAYNEALAWANADRREDRSEFAVRHIRELEPLLARLVLKLPARTRVNEVTIIVDGETLEAMHGVRIPVNPGKRELEIEADGRQTFITSFTAVAGEEVSVTVPEMREKATTRTGGTTDGDESGGMSMGGSKTGNPGPTPIKPNPGGCGCRAAAQPQTERGGIGGIVAVSAALAMLGFAFLRRRR